MRRTKTMNLEGAERYCAELSIAGVGQWRLPTVGELSTLSHNLIIGPRGLFWSSTDADAFGNQRLVWNAKARRLFASSSKWRGGRIVCVRDHGPPEEATESGTDESPDE
jgi:hypothetical protein